LPPFGVFTGVGFSLVLAFLFGNRWINRPSKNRKAPSPVLTWDCGYIQPASSMQYSASSYAQTLVDFFKWVLVPEKSSIQIKGLFPNRVSFHSHVPETVLERVFLPVIRGGQWIMKWPRYLQTGYLQTYVFYIFLTFLFFILWR
jgi:hydrogenase-4 component B